MSLLILYYLGIEINVEEADVEESNVETNLILNIENINDNHDINIPIEIVENSRMLYNESIDYEIINLINIDNVDSNCNFDTGNKLLEGPSENIETLQSSKY